MELWKFERKNVKIICVDGRVIQGFARHFGNAEDDDEGLDNLTIVVEDSRFDEYVTEDEVVSIEVLD